MFQSIRWTPLFCLVAVAIAASPLRQSWRVRGRACAFTMRWRPIRWRFSFVTVNGSKSNVVITNLTEEAIDIRLPDAVVAVP